jgi:hypothetical protein
MGETVTNGAGTTESVTTVTGPKRDRAAYMRQYRMLQKLNGKIKPELENSQPNIEPQPDFKSEIIPDIPPQPKLNSEPKPKILFKSGRYNADMPRILPPEVVRDIGNGNIANGRRVLQKFVAKLRARHQHADEPQARYARGGAVKIDKADADYHDSADSGTICAICRMYRREHKCSLVRGFISRTASCRFFEKA